MQRDLSFLPGMLITMLLLSGAAGCGATDKAAKKEFLAALGNTTVTVFPAFVRGRSVAYDDAAAGAIAEELARRGLARIEVSDAHVPLGGAWHRNEARMFRESASAFADWLRAHPVATSYALLPEYLGGPDRFVAVHFYVVDGRGRLALGGLFNSHWREFKAVKPRTTADCTRVALLALEELKLPAK